MDSSMTAENNTEHSACRISCDSEFLRKSATFSGVSPEVIKLFAYLSSRRSFKAGDYLIAQGEKANQAFFVVKGTVEITVHHRNKEIVLQELEAHAFFGELALLAKFQWFFNARAKDDLEVIVIDQKTFQKVIEKFPESKDLLTERVIQARVDRLVQQTAFMIDTFLDPEADKSSAAIV
ncbi:MAG: cyclic nucleotide-binding domain-containing protein [Desulfobulbaceae bacterium]|nr:MAG: cyclic nucleotide-binding domain-containing protein [Desulfobulbaceae bacterium]